MHSEELLTLEKALEYCDELKTHLRDAIGHIEGLNKRYNQIDYVENMRLWEKSRTEFFPYINHLQSQLSLSPKSMSPYSPATPLVHRHRNQRLHKKKMDFSTPKVSSKIGCALEILSPIERPVIDTSNDKTGNSVSIRAGSIGHFDPIDGPTSAAKRTVQQIKYNNNTITVRTLKVQRNIETMLNHLKVLQKIQHRNHAIALEQSLYQSCNTSTCNTSTASPGKLGHSHCNQNRTFGITPNKNLSHKCVTPLRKHRMQTILTNSLLIRSC